jgi:drug/metabolite transporter (DMT)-like permease
MQNHGVNRESFSMSEMASAVAICTGLALFAFADMSGSTKASTFLGLALQAGSVVADAFLPNLQQRLFKRGASAVEVLSPLPFPALGIRACHFLCASSQICAPYIKVTLHIPLHLPRFTRARL